MDPLSRVEDNVFLVNFQKLMGGSIFESGRHNIFGKFSKVDGWIHFKEEMSWYLFGILNFSLYQRLTNGYIRICLIKKKSKYECLLIQTISKKYGKNLKYFSDTIQCIRLFFS